LQAVSLRLPLLIAIREQYNILNTLALYLQEVSKTSVDKMAWSSIASIQNNVYNIMCIMKMVLRAHGHDPDNEVPSGQLSHHFYENVKFLPDRCLQQNLEYVIVRDCKKVATYLERFYRNDYSLGLVFL
jgi:hypothetical protein